MNDKTTIIDCPACEGKVSSAASSCPHCGHPINEPEESEEPLLTQPSAEDEINQSGRFIKVVSGLMMVVGMIVSVAGNDIGFWLLFLGFFGFVVGRFMD